VSDLERTVGEVELALRGEEPSPSWGPLAQAVAALRRSGDDCADCRWRRGCLPPHLGLGSRDDGSAFGAGGSDGDVETSLAPALWRACEGCEAPHGCEGLQMCADGGPPVSGG
jgi:hypothetical protein